MWRKWVLTLFLVFASHLCVSLILLYSNILKFLDWLRILCCTVRGTRSPRMLTGSTLRSQNCLDLQLNLWISQNLAQCNVAAFVA
uniref:Uncharacterized protein n=1 Tax=Hyaloperonospora arabidopsidis (strain Emoy2) TaxID=559515 RepID=M4B447_HYAAE